MTVLRAKSIRKPSGNDLPPGYLTRGQLNDLPGVEWMIDGLFERNSIAFIYGLRGACKSFFMLGLAASIATGTAFLGHEVNSPGRVVYVVAEAANNLSSRLDAWETNHDDDTDGSLFVKQGMDLADQSSVDHFIRDMKRMKPAAIFFSPFYKMTIGVEESNLSQQGVVADRLDQIREATGALVVIENHTNAEGHRMSGHSVLERIAWTEVLLTNSRGYVKASCRKQRNAIEFPDMLLTKKPIANSIVLQLLPDVVPAGPQLMMDANDQKMGQLLVELKVNPMTAKQLCHVTGIPKSTVYRLVGELKKTGQVSQEGQVLKVAQNGSQAVVAIPLPAKPSPRESSDKEEHTSNLKPMAPKTLHGGKTMGQMKSLTSKSVSGCTKKLRRTSGSGT